MRAPNRAAVVLNVGWVPGISTLQTLGPEGVPTYAVDHRADALGFRSRHAHAHRLAPRRVDDEDAWIASSSSPSATRNSSRG